MLTVEGMSFRNRLWRLGGGIALLTALYGFQRPFRVYRSLEPYDNVQMPPDSQEKTDGSLPD